MTTPDLGNESPSITEGTSQPAGLTITPQCWSWVAEVNGITVGQHGHSTVTVLTGVPFAVNGEAGCKDSTAGPPTVKLSIFIPGTTTRQDFDVSVNYDNGAGVHMDFGPWSQTGIIVNSPGEYTITVTGGTNTVTLRVIPAVLTVRLIEPVPTNSVCTVTRTPLTIKVNVDTNGPPATRVEFNWDSAGYQPIATPLTGVTWIQIITLPSTVAPTGVPHSLSLKATNQYGALGTLDVTVNAVDGTKPVVNISSPADRQFVAGTEQGASVEVDFSVSDTPPSALASGIDQISVAVDGTTVDRNSIVLTSGDGVMNGTWKVMVPLQPLNIHPQLIVVTGVDKAGNPKPAQVSVIVALPLHFNELSEQTYLRDLIDFASLRLTTVAPDPAHIDAAHLPHINAGHLREAFHQNFEAIWKAAPTLAGGSVHMLRLVVQVLLDYLQPAAGKAAIARWPLTQATLGADIQGTGNDGIIQGPAAWVPGPPHSPGKVLAFDGSTFVQVGHPDLRVIEQQFTVTAWIQPASFREHTVIAGQDQLYMLGINPDGTIDWAIRDPANRLTWVSTYAVAPVARWSHVALVFDGSRVHVYLHGVRRYKSDTDVAVNLGRSSGDFLIGSQPSVNSLFQGAISDVRLYDRSLSAWDVAMLMSPPTDHDEIWIDDDLPVDAQSFPAEDGWNWVTTNPAPFHGSTCHQSKTLAGMHQHSVITPNEAYLVDRGDRLFTYVYLDQNDPPDEVMLQWLDADNGWEHRAYWGVDVIQWGDPARNPASRYYAGPIDSKNWLGRWVRLELPAAAVGLEEAVVQGFAFTLHGGKATWDYTGKASYNSSVVASGYTAAGYRALLIALGTSYDELRLARSATPAARAKLAARLGFDLSLSRPDELDQLLIDVGAVTDADLETRFGLLPPAASLLGAVYTVPLLAAWRKARLQNRWKAEDLGQGDADFSAPIVDPDVVQLSEIVNPRAGDPAYDLWGARAARIVSQTAQLANARAGQATELGAVNAVIAAANLGIDLDQLQSQLASGLSITDALVSHHLSMAGFRRLLDLKALAATGPLQPSEWDEVFAILVQVQKVVAFPQWRTEESRRGLVVGSDNFALLQAGSPLTLAEWRATWDARLDWADRLRSRTQQQAELDQGLQAARFAAEEASLPLLRDSLVLAIGYGIDISVQLTGRLFIDVQSGPSLKTTPVDQALATLQTALDAILTRSIESSFDNLPQSPAAGWSLAETPTDFELEWTWMGAYATWRSAMSTFFFPENILDPRFLAEGLLPPKLAPSPGFFKSPPPPPPSPMPWLNTFIQIAEDPTSINFDPRFEPHDTLKNFTLPADVSLPLPVPTGLETNGVVKVGCSEQELSDVWKYQRHIPVSEPTYLGLPAWAREAFFLIPLKIAIALQRVGRYQESLNWLRTVYDHNRARSASPDLAQDPRAIFAGFGLDQGNSTGLVRPTNWLLSDLNPHVIATLRFNTHFRFTLYTIARCLIDFGDAEFTKDTPESRGHSLQLYLEAERVLSAPQLVIPDAGVPPNSLRDSLIARAVSSLNKLHLGLNIAGIQRPLGPAADPAAIPPPSPYRYSTLISRARQLLANVADLERQYLSALQTKDTEQERLLQAGGALALANAQTVSAQDQAQVAHDEIGIAIDQQNRANAQVKTYGDWISAGPNDSERAMLRNYQQAANFQELQIGLQAVAQAASTMASAVGIDPVKLIGGGGLAQAAAVATVAAGGFGIAARDAEFHAQTNAFYGSLERQEDGWKLNRAMARWDATISGDQIIAATDRKVAADQQVTIATLQAKIASDMLTYLSTKFTSVQLYGWMVEVLGPIYRHQLQRVTAIAQLAQQQLAFERQQQPPAFVKGDYVVNLTAPSIAAARSGLTGSARLVSDLSDLDAYAFSTDQRKLQLVQTFSLSQLAPIDFIRLRETGDLSFTIPLSRFDQSFPGHYMRLLRRLRLSIIGLFSPTAGVKATLTSGGISTVVIPGDTFQALRMARMPETVGYTSPINATGTFELDAQPDLMNAFEGSGVDTAFRLMLPKPANAFNYASLADVLVTYEYTAMGSSEYARELIRHMPLATSNAIDFSLRRDFPDAWYTLLDQAQAPKPPASLSTQLSLTAHDFPVNLSRLRIEQVTLMVLRLDQTSAPPVPVKVTLRLSPLGHAKPIQSDETSSVDDIISTRSGTGNPAWTSLSEDPTNPGSPRFSLTTLDPIGSWALSFANEDTVTGQAFKSGDITDVVLVVAYAGVLPSWPVL